MKGAFAMGKLSSAKFFEKKQGYYASKKPLPSALLHSHDFFEIEIVCDGNAVHQLNRELINVSRGYAALLKKRDYHAYHFKGTESLTLYSICFED